jgi:Flp pilus assembly protein TadB
MIYLVGIALACAAYLYGYMCGTRETERRAHKRIRAYERELIHAKYETSIPARWNDPYESARRLIDG